MSRYGGNGISKTRQGDFEQEIYSKPSWIDQYAETVSKYSTRSKEEDASLFNQINSILNGKSKFSTVEEVVADLKRRSGLNAYLEQVKKASGLPEIFGKVPAIKTLIDNYTETFPGSSVEAVIQHCLKNPQIKQSLPMPDDVPDDVKQYINAKINENSPDRNHSEDMQLGKVNLDIDNSLVQENNPMQGMEAKKF